MQLKTKMGLNVSIDDIIQHILLKNTLIVFGNYLM